MDVVAQIAYWRDSALEDWVELKNLIDQTEEVLTWLIQPL